MKTKELFDYDLSLGIGRLAGVDEAGRGPLAGPVVTACCMLGGEMIDRINDSKKLSESVRERLYEQIISRAAYRVSVISHTVIDEINILEATKRGMRECIAGIVPRPELVLIDAVKLDTDVPTRAIIHGDAISYNIAAASILAKVTRDRIMREMDELYPQYGFARNKGYGTAEHIAAIRKYGPCPLHRRSFIGNFIEVNDDKHER